MKKVLLIFLLFCHVIISINAAVIYDKLSDTIWVSDFPEEIPCTPARLYQLDRMYDWEKITYDPDTDTYQINCNLWIGSDNHTDTYFQIGNRQHFKETVIVRGNIFIKPYRLLRKGEHYWKIKEEKYINRLTLGVAENDAVKPTLKIDNSTGKGNTLIIGGASKKYALGGQLCAYNAVIGPLENTPGKCIGEVTTGGKGEFITMGSSDLIRISGCRIYGVASLTTYGFNNTFGRITDTVFEDCRTAIVCSGVNYLKGCTFKNCGYAVRGWSFTKKLTLEQCRFIGNRINFYLPYLEQVLCIDCVMQGTERSDGIFAAWHKKDKTIYPKLLIKNHLTVKVINHNGQPIKGAVVKCSPKEKNAAVPREITGKTNANGFVRLLLLKTIKSATVISDQPDSKNFKYTITVTVGSKCSCINNFFPKTPRKIVTIVL